MTAPRSVGSVSVSVVPDARGWIEKLRAEIEPGSDKVGEDIGKRIGEAMYLGVLENIEKIKLKLDELGQHEVRVRVIVDDNGGLARTDAALASTNAAAASGGGGFSIFGGKIALIGLAAVAAADVAIPAILAIGAAAAGALAGVGVLALGFSGIGAALQAHGQPSPGGGTGVQGAQLGLQSAQISAANATQTAQDQLTSAIQAQSKAEYDLHLARQKALQDLQDLDNKLKDNTLSQVQAAINLKLAEQTLAVSQNAPGANQAQYANQIAQARLNVATAQQKVNELTLEGTRLTAADALAHKQGVAGNPNVQGAQQTLVNANRKLVESQDNITTTAQKNAIALQQAQLAMISAAAGANAFGQAMNKLNPIQRDFVNFLLSLKPLFDQIKSAASGFLPGLTQGIKNALPAFGPLLTLVGNVAKALGGVFANIGAQFATPAGQRFITFLSVELPKQIVFLGNLFIGFGKVLAGIFQAAAPLIQAFDTAILGALNAKGGGGLSAFFNSLIPVIQPLFQALGAISSVTGALLKAIVPALGPVLSLITLVAKAVVNLISGPVGHALINLFNDLVFAVIPLIPLFTQILQTILPPLIGFITTLVNGGIAPLVLALVSGLAPVLPVIGQALTDVAAALGPLISSIVTALLPVLPILIGAFVGLVKAVAPFLVQLANALVPILPVASKLLIDILNAVVPLVPQFGLFLKALTPLIKPFSDLVISLLQLTDKLLPVLLPLFLPFINQIPAIVKILQPLVDIFATLIGWIKDFIDYLGKIPGIGVLKDIISFFSGGSAPSAPAAGGNVSSGGQTYNPGIRGARASGGPVLAGVPYNVNEVGPEIFVPQVNGYILDANRTKTLTNGSKHGRNVTQYITTNDPTLAAHAFANRLAARAV